MLLQGSGYAQTSTLRSKKIPATGVVQLDSLSIVPGTLLLQGADSSYYYVDLINAVLTWKKKPFADSVLVNYRVFPFRLNKVVQRYSYDSVRNNFIAAPGNAAISKKTRIMHSLISAKLTTGAALAVASVLATTRMPCLTPSSIYN